jgi:hypothetical protein
MPHEWLSATDKPGTALPSVLFDLEKRLTYKTIIFSIINWRHTASLHPTKNWILDFLIDQKQCVTLRNSGMSEWRNIRAGVPRRTKLGPWLYALMINDLSPPQTRCESLLMILHCLKK